jgi:hypothetical protein
LTPIAAQMLPILEKFHKILKNIGNPGQTEYDEVRSSFHSNFKGQSRALCHGLTYKPAGLLLYRQHERFYPILLSVHEWVRVLA